MTKETKVPGCPYCSRLSEKVTGAVLYPNNPKVRDRWFYRCRPCKAWVGTHEGTDKPLGRLADATLRRAKQDAHKALDPLWRAKIVRDGCRQFDARESAYVWLAGEMGIRRAQCHIGLFNPEQCQQVIAICAPYAKRAAALVKRGAGG